MKCDVLILGAGPGGYVCAIRCAQAGLDTIVVDEAKAGGTCLNVGCIPSKALIHAADEMHKISHMAHSPADSPLGISVGKPQLDYAKTIGWKDSIVTKLTDGVEGLLKRAGAKYVQGSARFMDGKRVRLDDGSDTGVEIRADRIVVATGSAPVELPGLPFGGDVLSSTDALALTTVPKTMAVVGAGYIGLELGTAFAKLGSKVTIVEASDRIMPLYDAALTRPVAKRLDHLGVTVMTGTKAQDYTDGALQTDQGAVTADKVLVTVGRRPRTRGIGIDELALTLDGAYIKIDEHGQTSMRGIYAIGDVTGEPMLAHRAMAQGEMVARHISDQSTAWDKRAIPAVCFTDPEIVSVGNLPGAEGTKAAEFPFAANGRAMTVERDDGFIRVVFREGDHAITGIQAVGAGVSELSAAFALAVEMGARLEDIAETVHAHPTQSEGFQEAALKALGAGLHF
ncbi:MAG: dihydrolipoyl dehydrogenase [Pseudomonadota bacterium]